MPTTVNAPSSLNIKSNDVAHLIQNPFLLLKYAHLLMQLTIQTECRVAIIPATSKVLVLF